MELFNANGGNITIKRPSGEVVLSDTNKAIKLLASNNYNVGSLPALSLVHIPFIVYGGTTLSVIGGADESIITIDRDSVISSLPAGITSVPLVYIKLTGDTIQFPDTYIPIRGSIVLATKVALHPSAGNISNNFAYLCTASVIYDSSKIYVYIRHTFSYYGIGYFYVPGWTNFTYGYGFYPVTFDNVSCIMLYVPDASQGPLVCHDTAINDINIHVKEIAW